MSENVLHQAIRAAGGATKLARALGISHQAVLKWRKLPAERALEVERLTGVSRYDLRPDIYGCPVRDCSLPQTVSPAGA